MITKHTIRPLALAIIMAGLAACEPEIEREYPAEASGQADFSTYVALGNSLTAGFADEMLNRAGQVNSYPAIIADKMAAVTPDFTFNQPLMPEGTINGTLQFHGLTSPPPPARPTPILIPKTDGIPASEAGTPVRGTMQNLGIPDAKAADLTRAEMQTSTATFFYARFRQQGQSPVQMATAQNPTFFTLWIGNNDILEYATFGGEDNPSTPHTETITPVEEYEASMQAIVSQLKQANSSIKGAVANIGSLDKAPYFNVVPWNAFVLESQAQVDQLTAAFAANLNPAIRSKVILGVITEGARRQIIREVVTEGARRQIIAAVAPQVIFGREFQEAKQENPDLTDQEAAAIAQTYVDSEQGQQEIAALKASLTDTKTPEEIHKIVTDQLATQAVQDQINTTSTAAYSDISILGAAGEETVTTTLASQPVQDQIKKTHEFALSADANGQLAQVLGAEGAATVDAIQTQTIETFKAAGYYPTFKIAQNGFVVASNDSPTTIKQLTSSEKMTLRFLKRTTEEFDPSKGLVVVPDKYALDAAEMQRVNQAITSYNQVIATLASENNLALVDMNAFLNQVVTEGVTAGGKNFTNAYIAGNAFSLDGVHLTQAGYALVAQKFIEAINSKYNSKLSLPDISRYPTVALPPSE